MKPSKIVLLCVASLVILMSSVVCFAQDEDPAVIAADLAERATERYQNGDSDGAIDLFIEALSYVRDPAFAYNLAFIYDELETLPQAYRFYNLYLELYPGAPNRDDIESRLDELEGIFQSDYAQLSVSTTPSDVDILVTAGGRIDNYGRSPLESFVIPGAVEIAASEEGYESATRSLNAVAGVRLEVDIGLLPVEAPISAMTVAGWSVLGVGVVVTTIGTIFWIQSSDSVSTHEDRLVTAAAEISAAESVNPPRSEQELASLSRSLVIEINQLQQDAEDQAFLGNLLFGIGVSAIVGGAVLLLLDTGSERDNDHASLDILLFEQGAGLGWSARF